MKKRQSDVSTVPTSLYSIFMLCFLMTCGAFVVLYLGFEAKSEIMYIIGFALAAAVLVIVMIVAIINWFRGRNFKFVNFDDLVYSDLLKFFTNINEHY